MKTKNILWLVMLPVFGVVFLYSCLKNDDFAGDLPSAKNEKSEVFTLTEKTHIGDNIYLPAGTKWYYTDESMSKVEFILPEGYMFLVEDFSRKSNSSNFELLASGEGYSCSCSGEGSCTVFYNKDTGFGCLHSSCTGDCIGRRTKNRSNKVIEGVVYVKNDLVDIRSENRSSLSQRGVQGLLSLDIFQKEIKEMYDFLYRYYEKPDFDNIEKNDNTKYVFAKVFLYGFEFGIIFPNDTETIRNYLSDMNLTSLDNAPTSCSCSGGNQGGNCKLEKKGMFGYVVYFCTGCQTCTMN